MAWNKKGDFYQYPAKRRILEGKCIQCEEPHAPGHRFCYEHLEKHNQYSRAYKDRLRRESRCTRCGCPLHPEMDKGHTKCLNCREHLDSF